MRRLNPETGLSFKRGDKREDGFLFLNYLPSKVKQDGYCTEIWCNPERFEREVKAMAKRRLKCERNRQFVTNAKTAKRRAEKKQRTPVWVKDQYKEEIGEFYKLAKALEDFTGHKWEVDHIVPMKGELVSGLHVPWNLQLLPKKDNAKKGNRFHVC